MSPHNPFDPVGGGGSSDDSDDSGDGPRSPGGSPSFPGGGGGSDGGSDGGGGGSTGATNAAGDSLSDASSDVTVGSGTGGRTTPDDNDPRRTSGGGSGGDAGAPGGLDDPVPAPDPDPDPQPQPRPDPDPDPVRLEDSQTTDDSTLLVGEGAARPDAVVAGVDPDSVVAAAVDPTETVAGARREFGADQLDERTQTNVDADDVSLGDDLRTVRLDERAARREGRARTDVDGITAASSDVALGLRAEQQLPDVTAQSADVALGLTAQREAQRQRAIEALETSIGAQRADRSGVTGGTLRNEVIDDTELVPGEDVAVRPADGGGIRAEPTQELIEEEASREAQALFGQDLDRGEDFTVETETLSESEAAVANTALGALGFEEGGVTAGPRASVELTNEGVDAVAQTPSGLPGEGGARGAQSEAAATGEVGFADALFGVRDASRRLQTQANENVIDPVARNVGQGVDLLSLDEEANVEPGAQTAAGQRGGELTEEAGEGATDIVPGGVASVIDLGALGVGAAEFTGEAVAEEGPVEGGATAATAGAGFAATTGARLFETAAEDPGAFAARLAGSGVAGAAVSPPRVARFDVPTRQRTDVEADVEGQRVVEGIEADVEAPAVGVPVAPGTSTTLRGLRVQTPPALEAVGVRARGRTVAGTRGGRPTLGAPSVAPLVDDLDFSRAGATSTAAVEPGSAFEADISRSTAADIGAEGARRFETAEGLQREAQRRENVGFTAESAEEAVGQARAVPESAAGDVAEALRDVDATVFGSAAARAQIEEFRQPRDLDIVVDDKAEAKPRLAESLAGENAGVGEVFDIKEVEDVPGRARGGEEIKFGRTSREPRELDGIPFNPVEEELVRKAGASAFLRSPEATNTPNRLDIGPEPRSNDPDSGVREKDPEDAAAIGREIGLAGREVEEFEEAFGLRQADAPDGPRASGRAPDEQPAGGLFGGLDDALGVRQLAADERAQLGGGRRRGRQDLDAPVRGDRDDGGPATGAGRVEQRTDADSPSASPAGRDTPATSPAASPAGADSLGGAPVGAEEGGSPAASPRGRADTIDPLLPSVPAGGSPGVVGGEGDGGTPTFEFNSPRGTPARDTPTFTPGSPVDTPGIDTPTFGIVTVPTVREPTTPQRPEGRELTDPDRREPRAGEEGRATPLFQNPVLGVFGGGGRR